MRAYRVATCDGAASGGDRDCGVTALCLCAVSLCCDCDCDCAVTMCCACVLYHLRWYGHGSPSRLQLYADMTRPDDAMQLLHTMIRNVFMARA